MKWEYDDNELGSFTITYRGCCIRATKYPVESPRREWKKQSLSFISCESEVAVASRLHRADYDSFKCPDKSTFEPCGNIYIDIKRFVENDHSSVSLSNDNIELAELVVKEKYVVFPVWACVVNGKIEFTHYLLKTVENNRWILPKNLDNATLFGAMIVPLDYINKLAPELASADIAQRKECLELLMYDSVGKYLQYYTHWVNGGTYTVDVFLDEDINYIIEDNVPDLYAELVSRLGSTDEVVKPPLVDKTEINLRGILKRIDSAVQWFKFGLETGADNTLSSADMAKLNTVLGIA